MGNAIVHFELLGPNAEELQRFYAELLGWQIQHMPEMNYGLIDTQGGEGINGGIGQPEDGAPGRMMYVAVPDLQATLDKIGSLGGTTIVPPTEIPDVVTFAVFGDRQGNKIGLVKAVSPAPEGSQGPSQGSGAPLGWWEIASGDPKDARAFYTEVFDWKIASETEGDFIYYEVDPGNEGISGAICSSQDGTPNVNLWAKVDDLTKYLERAETLGGKKVMDPMAVNEGLTVAGFVDPAGNFFGLYTMSHTH